MSRDRCPWMTPWGRYHLESGDAARAESQRCVLRAGHGGFCVTPGGEWRGANWDDRTPSTPPRTRVRTVARAVLVATAVAVLALAATSGDRAPVDLPPTSTSAPAPGGTP